MLSFHAATPGNIGPVALFGSIQIKGPIQAPEQYDKEGKRKVVPPEDLVEFDYAQEAYGSKVSDVVGGDPNDAQNVLNSDPNKSLTLGAIQKALQTADNTVKMENIFVVDMGEKHDINKVALLYQTSSDGKFEFYFLNTLPTKPKETPTAFDDYLRKPQPILLASNDNRMAAALLLAQTNPEPAPAPTGDAAPIDYLPPNFFSTNKPGYSQDVKGSDNTGRITGVFESAQSFRYALIRWVPTPKKTTTTAVNGLTHLPQPILLASNDNAFAEAILLAQASDNSDDSTVTVYRVNLIGKVPLEDIGLAADAMVNALDPTGKLPAPHTGNVFQASTPPTNTPTTPDSPPTGDPPPTTTPTNTPAVSP
jgi:hypothetical protein